VEAQGSSSGQATYGPIQDVAGAQGGIVRLAPEPLRLQSRVSYTALSVQHSRAGTVNLCTYIADLDTTIALVQELWINTDKILGFCTSGAMLHRVRMVWDQERVF